MMSKPFPLKNFPLGPGHINVTITDMERKWDINLVANPRNPQKEILQKALAEVGVHRCRAVVHHY